MKDFLIDIYAQPTRSIHNFYGAVQELIIETEQTKHLSTRKWNTYSNIHDFYPDITKQDPNDKEFHLYKRIEEGRQGRKDAVEGNRFQIMLPLGFFDKTLLQQEIIMKEVVKQVIPMEYKLIFFSNVMEYGEGIYMNILVVDREFYPKGIEVPKLELASCTQYKDNITHQTRSHEYANQNPDKVYLAQTKGEVLGSKIVYFGTKFREYCGNKYQKFQKELQLKRRLQKVFLKHFVIKKYRNFVQSVKLSSFNAKLKEMNLFKIIEHNRLYWFNYRKKQAVNNRIQALNNYLNIQQHNLMKETSMGVKEARVEIEKRYFDLIHEMEEVKHKYVYGKMGNVDTFEKTMQDKISEIGILNKELYSFAKKLFKDKLVIV